MARGSSCCLGFHLREDNARFVLLAILILIYLFIGASIFSAIEREQEIKDKDEYENELISFITKYGNQSTNFTEFEMEFSNFLIFHEEMVTKGLIRAAHEKRDRWDFSGAFYFVGTVVSTIGFGMTSPSTELGRGMVMIYGLAGCAATILFFNIFLERLITFLAYVLRSWHEYQVRKQTGAIKGELKTNDRRGSVNSDDLDNWKPSVYYVMLILIGTAFVIGSCGAAMYSYIEGWSYLEAAYFCFVAFSTIGFGDYVPSQLEEYPFQTLYRVGNFLFLVLGTCLIYSFFNVLTIVIKQFLNWVIKKLDCRCCNKPRPRARRNAITPGHIQETAESAKTTTGTGGDVITDVDSNYDSETDGRRMSGEMISMKDFFAANKVSLAVMQKQLYETSQNRQREHFTRNGALSQGVGPLAMLNNKLQETENRD